MAIAELPALEQFEDLRATYRAFLEEHVYPAEAALNREDDAAEELMASLRARAKAEGLWAPHLPPEAGGTGQGFLAYAYLNEEIGRSSWGQLVFNCQAPDAGNGEILHLFGTDEQKEQFLRPLVEGDTRSFFSMTEPDVSGSDPTLLRTRAVLRRGRMGHRRSQVVLVGRRGSGLRDRHGDHRSRTREPHRRASQILVPADTPGITIEPVPVMGHRGRGWTTHCEVTYDGVRVPAANVLGRARRRLPHRAEAARPWPHPPRHALARPDAARLRPHVLVLARSARRSAGRSPRSRRCRTGSPTRRPRSTRAG